MSEHWKTFLRDKASVPDVMVDIPVDFEIAEDDWTYLRDTGAWPKAMEDKWVIVYCDPSLEFYRSWTGNLIFRLAIDATQTPVRAGPAQAARADWYNHKTLDEAAQLERLVTGIAARRGAA